MKKNKILAGLLAVSLFAGMMIPAMAEAAGTTTEPTPPATTTPAPEQIPPATTEDTTVETPEPTAPAETVTTTTVKDFSELTTALASADIKTITFSADITANTGLVLDGDISIDGAGHTLTVTGKADNTSLSAVVIAKGTDATTLENPSTAQEDGADIKNLTIVSDNPDNKYPLQVYRSKGVILENVTLTHNKSSKGAGLLVNASHVTLKGKTTINIDSAGAWYGIGLGNGEAPVGSNETAKITFATGATVATTGLGVNPVIQIDSDDTEKCSVDGFESLLFKVADTDLKYYSKNTIEWNTGVSNKYGTVSIANGKTTLTAIGTATDTHYYAPYTTFGRGKESYTFGKGFETSVTLDISKMADGDRIYWETGLNGKDGEPRKDSVQTSIEKASDGIKIIDGYLKEDKKYVEETRTEKLSTTASSITIKTKLEPFTGKVRLISTVIDGKTTSTKTTFIKDAPDTYGSARYGWVYFNEASKTVDVSDVTYRDLSTSPAPAVDKTELISELAKARELSKTVVKSTDGTDVATSKQWATEEKITAYSEAIDAITDPVVTDASTQEEVNALLKSIADAIKDLGAQSGTKAPIPVDSAVTGSNGSGTATITPPSEGGTTTAKDDIVATLPAAGIKAVISAANNASTPKPAEITVTLPEAEKGTVTAINVPKEVFTAASASTSAAAKKVVFEVKDDQSDSQVKWEFDTSKGVPSGDINLMATPKQDAKVVLDTTVTGLDTSATEKADLIKFEYSGTIPAGTKVTVPTTVTVAANAKAYAYALNSNGTVNVNSEAIVTIANGSASFEPKHFSDILISATKIQKIVIPTPPGPVGPTRPSYSGGGSSTPTTTPSSDLSTIISNSAVSANTPKGTKVEVPSSISDPTFDTREIALNAPEAKTFVDTAASAGFAFAKVFQMNLFDGTTKVTKVSDGRVKISLPFTGKTGYDYVVLRYETNGGITAMPALYKDGQITFTTDHFSLYAIAVASSNKNLFADTTVKPAGSTSVPQTSVCTLGKLF